MGDRVTEFEILQEIRRLLEIGWTQGALARDETDREVDPMVETARRWCFVGAAIRARLNLFGPKIDEGTIERALRFAYRAMGDNCFIPVLYDPVNFNDRICKTQQQMLKVMDDALDLAAVGD